MSFSKTKALIILLSMAFLLGVFAQSAEAAVRCVKSDSSGADGKGLTWATAFTTVTAAINAAAFGDEIWVAAGTYYERITLKDGVALYGGFGGTETALEQRNWRTNIAILDGQQGGRVVTISNSSSSTTCINGFTIRNGYNYTGAGIYCSSSSPTINNNILSGNTATNGSGGGILCNLSSPTISNNTISGNTSTYGGGIYCYRNNSSPVISNNTISGNAASYGGGIYVRSSSPTINNNIIAFNNEKGILSSSGSATLSHNCVFEKTCSGYTGLSAGIEDIQAEPKFLDSANGDFRLQFGSPCIDTGDDGASNVGTVDRDGIIRIIGSHIDMGAYEWHLTAALSTTAGTATNKSSIPVTITFNSTVIGLEISKLAIDNGIAANLSISETAYNVTITPGSEGAVTVGIADGTIQDTSGNRILGVSILHIIYDITPPTTPPIPDMAEVSDTGNSNTDNLTGNNTPSFTGTAEAGSTIRLYAGNTEIGSTIADGAGNWCIVSATLADGTYTITTQATDPAGNISSVSDGLTVTIDTVPPRVTSVNCLDFVGVATNAESVTYRVVFSETVNAVNTSDFTLTTTGTVEGTIVSVSAGNGVTFDVIINSIKGSGTLRLDLKNSGTGITDLAGNPISWGYAEGQAWMIDRILPTGNLNINNGVELTNDPAVTLTITADGTGSGLAQMRFSNDNQNWSGWEPFASFKNWTLGDSTDGIYTVYVGIQDIAGNISVFSDTITVKVDNPDFTPEGGNFNSPYAVSIICATPGAEIRYTIDDSQVTETSNLYNGFPILINSTATVNAKAFKSGWLSSDPTSATYTINSETIIYQPGADDQTTSANLLQTAQNFENDLAVQFNSTTLRMGKGKTGKISDLWLCYPNLIGYGTGQIRGNVKIVSAKLVLTVKGFKGNLYLAHKINLYQISDPDNLGAPYFGESGLRNGLDYQYRDHRPGRNIKWTNNDKNGDGNVNIGDLISGNTPVDTYEVIPAYFNEEGDTQIRLDVTESIKSWLTGNPNHGWFLSGDAADKWSFGDGVEFYGITDSIIANRPKLEVTYLDTNIDNNSPGIVTNLNSDCASGQVSLSWNNPTDNDFSGVLILRKVGLIPTDPTDGLAVYDQQGTIGSPITYRDTGLTNDQTYYYALFTYDNLRNYSRGISIKVIPTAGGRGPDAPAGLTVGLNGNELAFSWTDQSNNEKWFLLEQQKGTGDFVTVACPAANQQSFTTTLDDPNFELTPNTGYTYRISAVNDYGASIPSATYSLNTGAFLQSPANLAWTIISAGRVNVSWTNQAPDATGYRVAVCNSSREELWSYSLAVDAESFSVTGLQPGTEYLIKVVVVKGIETAAVWTEPIITAIDPKGGLL